MTRTLLVGATGMLGEQIATALLSTPGLTLRVLLRPGKEAVAASFRERGAEVAIGDAAERSSLPAALADVDVVVCALPNDARVFVPGHQSLIEAADAAGVRRFVPSDFSVDYFKIDADENDNLAMRKQVVPLFAERRLRPIHILIGAFMDTMLDPRAPFIDWNSGTLPYFGSGQQQGDFTSVRDAARYVAAACADPGAPEVLRFAGDVLSMPELAASIARGLKRPLAARCQGSLDDLAELIATRKAAGGNPWDWVALQYHHNMVSGRAKLDPLDNSRYGDVQPETVAEFAARTGEGNARGLSRSAV